MPTLLNMPDVVMNLILEKLDFCSIQSLRKSCRDLSRIIDIIKPEKGVSKVHLRQGFNLICLYLNIQHQHFNISYENWSDGCKVKREIYPQTKDKLLLNSDFVNVACRDIQLILETQKLRILQSLESIDVSSKLAENLQRTLESKNLKVRNFDITFCSQDKIMNFLPFLDPETLERITLRNSWAYMELDLSEISKLEQWKSVNGLRLDGFLTNPPISNLTHFRNVSMTVKSATFQTVLDLKEAFFNNANMKYFNIAFQQSEVSENQLIEFFGQPDDDGQPEDDGLPLQTEWYIEIPDNSGKLLSIMWTNYFVEFRRVEKSPQRAMSPELF